MESDEPVCVRESVGEQVRLQAPGRLWVFAVGEHAGHSQDSRFFSVCSVYSVVKSWVRMVMADG